MTSRIALAAAALALLVAPAGAQAAGHVTLLVKFRPGVGAQQAERVLASDGARSRRTIRGIGVRVVSVPSASAASARAALSRSADVSYAERDHVARPQETMPDDPFFPQGNFALAGGAWGWNRTHTTDAWDVTQGQPSIVVAVLDTGIKPQGLDFAGQVAPGYDVLDGSSDTTTNAGSHGTYVAGVVGLASGTGSGNAGYCPKCLVMPVQVGTDAGANYSDMATGITWAADHGARVLNLSWAGTSSSSTLADAVAYARSKGAVVFAAAGNSNCDCPTYPSATPGVLGVGGVGSAGTKASDSNYGTWVALAAPEGNMTAWPTLNGAPGYAPVGGTSVAAPAAAGIAALVLSAKPGLSGTDLESALETSAKAASFTVKYGEVDALAALRAVGLSDPQAASAPTNVEAPRVLVGLNGNGDTVPLTAAPQAGQVLVRGQGAWTGSSGLTLSSVQWRRCNPDGTGCTLLATSYKYTVQPADTGYALKLTVAVKNGLGTTTVSAPLTPPVGGTTQPAPPANTAPPAISGTAQAGQTLTGSTGTWTNSPTGYAYQWQRCDPIGANCTPVAGATAPTYPLGSADVGFTLQVAVTASNAAGSGTAASPASAVVQAAPPPPDTTPVNTSLPAISGTAQAGQSLTASTGTWTNSPVSYAYQWRRCDSSGLNCADIAGAGGSAYLLGSADVGSTLVVVVTAANAGGSASATSAATGVVQAPPPPPPQTLSWSGSFGGKGGKQSFAFSAGSGATHAELSFSSKCGNLKLALMSGTTTLASSTGPSVLTLDAAVGAGSYSYQVTGSLRCSFTLKATTAAP